MNFNCRHASLFLIPFLSLSVSRFLFSLSFLSLASPRFLIHPFCCFSLSLSRCLSFLAHFLSPSSASLLISLSLSHLLRFSIFFCPFLSSIAFCRSPSSFVSLALCFVIHPRFSSHLFAFPSLSPFLPLDPSLMLSGFVLVSFLLPLLLLSVLLSVCVRARLPTTGPTSQKKTRTPQRQHQPL